MSDDAKKALLPASSTDLQESLAFALRFAGRKRVHQADDVMARITAVRLVAHIEQCGFVLMRRPAAISPSTSGHRHSNTD